MRLQEIEKLKKLAQSFDVDPSLFDFANGEYQDTKAQIHRAAGVTTEDIQAQQSLMWNSMAEQYDATKFDDKIFQVEGNGQLKNCLVLSFGAREFGFAVKMLVAKYKANLTTRSKQIIDINKHLQASCKIRILWFIGSKQATNSIMEEMRKHNLRPRIIRDSFLRSDFVHYAHGKIYNMPNRAFQEMQQGQTVEALEKRTQSVLVGKN